jgi:hypothetical protein
MGLAATACEREDGARRPDAPADFEYDYAVDCGGDPSVVWHVSLSDPMDDTSRAGFCDCVSGIALDTMSPAGQMTNQTVFLQCLTDLVESATAASHDRR